MARKIAKWLLISLIFLFFIRILSLVVIRKDFYQWDFKTFYFAAHAHSQGLNPYAITALNKVSNSKIRFRFRYPPLTLWFFRLFSLFNYRTAYILFLSLKCLLAGFLVFLWARFFLKNESGIWFIVFSLLAFNTAIFVDIVSGNVSLIEQFGLWLAFVFLLKKRLGLFCLLLLIAAQFKITPLFFLGLLIFNGQRKKYLYLAGTVCAFVLLQGISYLTSPLYKEFLTYGGEVEKYMQSSYTLFNEVLNIGARIFGGKMPSTVTNGVFALFVLLVMFLSWKAIAGLKKDAANDEYEAGRVIIFIACLAYAVVMPRFLAYSHMIVIVPAYYALKRLLAGLEGALLFLLSIIHMPSMAALPGMEVPFDLLWRYHTVIVAFGIWVLYLYRISQNNKGSFKLLPSPA